ncbi:unnamed protein product [Vitrella brassicaformis CCMP3155]|uniref:Coatomer subunit alpha n=2 Tax=Vitrella brassicaformis TaxID=1169539 RepID=A0A0G4GK35_VITBC|nr:unnamed protein product [Vitrella brassicaformis CCMP3155]|mmetsp:Transcript_16557/g.47126  ORF Transcript_16557/g.47126 Transcript_16557/m.47126 type:complete len:1244 (-) Transcript_16557:1314-5045(-)|eukprot:CEM30295.1 unnamed protein product [Vitrella brassicaformis CCMP3155]
MLVKCETKSNRVKGLSFHPKLSWILASLHNGTIQLWDYRIGSLIDKFDEHEGPVRGVDFHPSQPLFVSGGDDYKIKVWNYKQRRCIFTLLGHLDYIRTVQFHPEYPWILSASDDQTVRIWNWQSRSCIAVLTGHNHYVMCAQFHRKDDLVVSASLDQTVRVWDISGLREKTVSISGSGSGPSHSQHADVFGTSDAVVKYVLEGHDRGVNWASFHPSLPLIVSGADDRLIKLWRMNETKAWEVDTLRGHFNNVSCVLFHPKKDLVLSNSEDRTIRVWDASKRTGIHTFRRENDRFWILTAHKSSNLIAVGHDSGMVVFKLDRERPACHVHGHHLYYIKDRYLTRYDLTSDTSTSLTSARRPPNPMASGPRYLYVNTLNPTEVNLLVYYQDTEGGSYDLVTCPVDTVGRADAIPTKTGSASSVAFIARNRFATLDKSGWIEILNLSNELSKRIEPPCTVDRIFPAGNNRLLLKSEEKVLLYDLTTRKTLGEVTCASGVRYIIWSPSMSHVALLSKHNILLADSKLENLYSLHENIRIKSGAWDEHGVFVYSTLSHVKYCLTNGDHGIIHSLNDPIYIIKVAKQHLYFLTREHTVQKQKLNCTEYLFKLALHHKQFNQVASFIKTGRLCGNAVIGYLKRKGHPEVALQFVEDPRTRFNLALEFGHIEEAMASAQIIDEKACWTRLGVEALRQGNHQIVEMVYQRTKNFERLSFLYLITGNIAKLRKMLKIAEMRGDVMSRFHNALMLGDVAERVKILAEVGQTPLAALTAKTHGLTEYSQALEEAVQGVDFDSIMPASPKLLIPPFPLIRQTDSEATNWPLLSSAKHIFENALTTAANVTDQQNGPQAEGIEEEMAFEDATGVPAGEGGWADEMGDFDAALGDAAAPGGGWGGDDLDFGTIETTPTGAAAAAPAAAAPAAAAGRFVSRGERPQQRWVREQPMVPDLVAAGDFEAALEMLRKRIGLINADPLQPLFLQAYQATWCYLPGLPHTPSMAFPLLASGTLKEKNDVPVHLFTPPGLLEMLRDANKLTTQGKFGEALQAFRGVLQTIPLVTATNDEEEAQLNESIEICREYVKAMKIEVTRKDLPQNQAARSVELASYLTTCKMQPAHLLLAVRMAMTTAFRAQNFITAASFAKRIIQGNMAGQRSVREAVEQASKCLAVCEQKASDAHNINYDPNEWENTTICAESLTVIPSGAGTARCPYCGTVVKAEFAGKLCPSCQLCRIGAKTLGMQFRPLLRKYVR